MLFIFALLFVSFIKLLVSRANKLIQRNQKQLHTCQFLGSGPGFVRRANVSSMFCVVRATVILRVSTAGFPVAGFGVREAAGGGLGRGQ